MNAQATKQAPAVSYTRVVSAMKKSQMDTQQSFFAALLLNTFTVETVGENQITIKNNHTGAENTALVVGSKLVIMTHDTIKKSGLALKLNHSIAMDTFAKSENAYVLDLDANTVKGAKIASGWVPADGLEDTITLTAMMALSNTTIVSTKSVDGAIEHFVIGQGKNVSTDSIAEVRATLTSIIAENGGFVAKEPAPKVSKKLSGAEKETSTRTSGKAMKVHAAILEENRKAQKKAGKDAELAQEILTRRNAEALQYA